MKLFSKLELSRSWKSLWLYIRLLDVKIFFDNFAVLILPRPNYFLTHPIKMRNFNCIDHFGEKSQKLLKNHDFEYCRFKSGF